MFNSHDDTTVFDAAEDRDLIASMNEASSFEELETLTKMARARLRQRHVTRRWPAFQRGSGAPKSQLRPSA